jgi:tagatose 1,6-diphosphate aldolase
MILSAGKLLGLRRLADSSGCFKIIALDQRPPLQAVIKAKRQASEATWQDVANVKRILAESLASEATALLMDPIYAWPNAYDVLRYNQGLMLTLEHAIYNESPQGRRSCVIPDWSISKIKRCGANGVKLLVWYRPDVSSAVLRHQQEFVRQIGEECVRFDIPFLLELLVYSLPDENPRHLLKNKTDWVLDSIREFAKPEYAVDLFKLENPVTDAMLNETEGTDSSQVQDIYNKMGEITGRPWVMLSAGTDAENFRKILTYAYRAGASGFLAGRAIWWQAFEQYFPDLQVMKYELCKNAVRYLRELNELTDTFAIPWSDHQVFANNSRMDGADQHFVKNYHSF